MPLDHQTRYAAGISLRRLGGAPSTPDAAPDHSSADPPRQARPHPGAGRLAAGGAASRRPAVSTLFSEQWLVQDRVSSEDIKPTADELVFVPFWRASLGYEQALEDALRVLERIAAHAG